MSELTKNAKLYRVEIPGREFIECEFKNTEPKSPHWKVIGSPQTLSLLRKLKNKDSDPHLWPLPEGNSTAEMLVRELLLKITDQWSFPLQEGAAPDSDPLQAELCHCRAVVASRVDQAILAGAHTIEKVRRMTSANTACGTCFPEIEKILNFRLQLKV